MIAAKRQPDATAVTVKQAEKIIDNKGPAGLYTTTEHCMYTAIYCDGDGLVEVAALRSEAERTKWMRERG